MTPQTIIQTFEERLNNLGDPEFILPRDLVAAGIFGSDGAVRKALNHGLFPFIRVSKHRVLIPKASILEHLRKSCNQQG